jgi:hypothetical protein
MASITSNGTYGPYKWFGGGGAFTAQGVFDSATVELYFSFDEGVTKTLLTSLTASGNAHFNIGRCYIFIVLSGGGGNLNVTVQALESEGAMPAAGLSASQPLYITSSTAVPVSEAVLTVRVDDTTDPLYTYLGFATPGSAEGSAVWQVRRVVNASGTILFADGDALYNNIWTNRVALSYS